MKTKAVAFVLILALAVIGCRTVIPRAIPVDTKPLQESVQKVQKQSKAVDRALEKVVGSNDAAIGLAKDSAKALDRVLETIRAGGDPAADIAKWRDAHARLMKQLESTRSELRNTLAEKQKLNESVVYLEAVVDALVKASIEQAKAIGEMSKELDKALKTREKLSWWRWYGVATTSIIVGYVFLRLFGAAIWAYVTAASGGLWAKARAAAGR